jgi:hypothetical protein
MSLGTVLFGFLGMLIFISYGDELRKMWTPQLSPRNKVERRSPLRTFTVIIWGITVFMALSLCVTLVIIQKEFGEIETKNPLRQPVLFSLGAVFVVLLIAFVARKNLLCWGRILLPGVAVGLVWASVVRDLFEGVYLVWPRFPLASEVLETVLVINFCFLGIAWLNKAAYDGY